MMNQNAAFVSPENRLFSLLPMQPDSLGLEPPESFSAQLDTALIDLCTAYAQISAAMRSFSEAYAHYCTAARKENALDASLKDAFRTRCI